MNKILKADLDSLSEILDATARQATAFLAGLESRPPAIYPKATRKENLPDTGMGAMEALERFRNKFENTLSGNAGARFFGFVQGGSTPAALAADWLVSAYDQNATGFADSSSPFVEAEAIEMLRELLNLPPSFSGTFVSGATMANFVGLAQGRHWCGEKLGVDTSIKGVYGLPPIKVFSATPHSSIQKTLCMLGMGRESLHKIPTLPNREAIDVNALEEEIKKLNAPCIVSASIGTVSTGDFDDLKSLASLKDKYSFWLHVDGAFGAFAAATKTHSKLTKGIEFADSITTDGHKWLNVPYDCGVQFTRHNDLQVKVFQNWAAYLTSDIDRASNLINLTPENSRRFRGLPVWVSLIAYGRQGIAEIVERNCALANVLSQRMERHETFELMAKTRLNIVSFTLKNGTRRATQDEITKYLALIRDEGKVFLSHSVLRDVPIVRLAISNWRTSLNDIDIAWASMMRAAQSVTF